VLLLSARHEVSVFYVFKAMTQLSQVEGFGPVVSRLTVRRLSSSLKAYDVAMYSMGASNSAYVLWSPGTSSFSETFLLSVHPAPAIDTPRRPVGCCQPSHESMTQPEATPADQSSATWSSVEAEPHGLKLAHVLLAVELKRISSPYGPGR